MELGDILCFKDKCQDCRRRHYVLNTVLYWEPIAESPHMDFHWCHGSNPGEGEETTAAVINRCISCSHVCRRMAAFFRPMTWTIFRYGKEILFGFTGCDDWWGKYGRRSKHSALSELFHLRGLLFDWPEIEMKPWKSQHGVYSVL